MTFVDASVKSAYGIYNVCISNDLLDTAVNGFTELNENYSDLCILPTGILDL